jgi:hypothetical protein
MDLSKIHEMAAMMRHEAFRASGQWTLGQLIEAVERKINEREGRGDEDAWVHYDFCAFQPTTLGSYRGYYGELALGYQENEDWEAVTAKKLLPILKAAVGQTFTGYKGGEFTMGLNTPLWVANYSETGSTAVVGVIDEGFALVIQTRYIP